MRAQPSMLALGSREGGLETVLTSPPDKLKKQFGLSKWQDGVAITGDGKFASRIGAIWGFGGVADDKVPFGHGRFELSSRPPRWDVK